MKNIVKIQLLIMAIAIASCQTKNVAEDPHAGHNHEEEEGVVELTKAQIDRAEIGFGSLVARNMSSVLNINGVLVVPPKNKTSVSPMMGGFIKSTILQEGIEVKKGQVIATIQNPDFIQLQSTFLENKSKLVYLRAEYNRQKDLSAENVSAGKVFQQVSAELNSLEISNRALEEQLKLININPATLSRDNIKSTVNVFAPISGRITQVNINIGKYVQPHDVLCEMIEVGQLLAEFTVFEKDLAKIKVGQKIRFTVMNEGDKERTAKVSLINHQITDERNVKIYATIDQHDLSLMPNMYLKAALEIKDAQVLTLPSEAIVNDGDKFYIFIKEQHAEKHEEKHEAGSMEFETIEVQKGMSQGDFTEVILPKDFDVQKAEIVIKNAYAILAKKNNSEESGGHAH